MGADARISLQQPGGDMQHQETAQPRGAGDCSKSMDPLSAAGKPSSPELATDGRQLFKVSFAQNDGMATELSHSFSWAGAGRIDMGATRVRIGGSRK